MTYTQPAVVSTHRADLAVLQTSGDKAAFEVSEGGSMTQSSGAAYELDE